MIGSNPFQLTRALVFLTANLVTGLAFMLARSMMGSVSLHRVYWQFAVVHSIAFTLATLLGFHFVRKGWIAAAVTAAGTVLVMLAFCSLTLLTFHIARLFDGAEFQEFLLVPLVDSLVTLLGLFFLIPRILPLPLALWTGAVCAEVATSVLLTTLRELDSGIPPDRILAGTLVFFVGVRSLLFAAAFWGGLKLTRIWSTSAR